ERLRAACALAEYAMDDGRWERVSGDVASCLVAENAVVIGKWADALQPVRRHLLPPLTRLLLDERRSAASCCTIARICVGYAVDHPDAFTELDRVLSGQSGPQAPQQLPETLAQKKAIAAVALAAVDRWKNVRPLLTGNTPDPTLRSYLIDRLG